MMETACASMLMNARMDMLTQCVVMLDRILPEHVLIQKAHLHVTVLLDIG